MNPYPYFPGGAPAWPFHFDQPQPVAEAPARRSWRGKALPKDEQLRRLRARLVSEQSRAARRYVAPWRREEHLALAAQLQKRINELEAA